jgi:transcriptional regulator with XRE-family HTH domain
LSSVFFSFEIIFFKKITEFIGMENAGKGRKTKEMSIIERIDTRLAVVGLSRPKLLSKAGVAMNTFANWAARGTIPPADIAIAFADELQCSVRWLITGENDKEENYTLEEKNLVNAYRNLDERGQFEIQTLLAAKASVKIGKEEIPLIITAEEKKQKAV